MKHSSLMVWILCVVVAIYVLIEIVERLRAEEPITQEWREVQLKPIGGNRFLLRYLDNLAQIRIVELQEILDDVEITRAMGSDLSPQTGSHASPHPYANTVRGYLESGNRGNQH